jgi:hypothetical protein
MLIEKKDTFTDFFTILTFFGRIGHWFVRAGHAEVLNARNYINAKPENATTPRSVIHQNMGVPHPLHIVIPEVAI